MEPMIAASARQLAEENGLDWRRIKGSGTGGQINEGDVLDYLMRVMSGEEELPEGSVDPIPATLEQDMAAMRSMIAGSGMAEEGELDSLMASTPALEPMFAPEPILAQADQEMLEDEMLEDEMLGNEMSEEERMAAISAPAVDDSLEADDFDFDMEDPLAASAAVPLPSYEAAPEPMAASAEPKSVPAELPSFEPMVLEDVTPLSDEDLAALMGDPLPSASVLPDALPIQMAAPVLEDDFAASSPEQDELEEVSAASVALEPAYTEPAYTEPEQTDLEPEPMAASAVQDSATDLEPLSAAPAVEDKPTLEEDYAALAGVPVLSVPEPVPDEPVLAAPVPVYIPASVPVYAPMASNRLSEVSLRVQFDVSALQEAALQLEPLIGQVGMAFFLARAVSRHAHLLGQSAVSHSRLSDGSYAPLHGIAGDFKAALEDYGNAAAGEALGIAVAYAGELGLEEASSAQAAYTVSLGKPFGETTGLTLRGEVSVQVGAAFLNAVADSLHKPITLLV
ncbi:MAG: E3 binding domain-containing protein [Pseudopedobacter sp.]|nr:E3 binding domain-containing protein [Deinococcales bacterium]